MPPAVNSQPSFHALVLPLLLLLLLCTQVEQLDLVQMHW
jgi:hypothetical protein